MSIELEHQWACHPDTSAQLDQWINECVRECPFASRLAERMRLETGTRFHDWVDYLVVPSVDPDVLHQAGFTRDSNSVWRHQRGMFPSVRRATDETRGLFIRVDSVTDFLLAHKIQSEVTGRPGGQYRRAIIESTEFGDFGVVERHGWQGFGESKNSDSQIALALEHRERFLTRRRRFPEPAAGFHHAGQLFRQASDDLGVDWACDLFFLAERRYWQSRNRAARVQQTRQDRLGLGWANHDHHTYRNSREHFAELIRLLESMGFCCRERFYGGAEAGWGAQVLEQTAARIVIFADVDLSPEEVTGDFAHEGLTARPELGTVGLWCALHDEAMLEAGMHHLECQFDFDLARRQLADEGIETMAPFTDFPYLKQAFTSGEIWQVADHRIESALERGAISMKQAERFRAAGIIGSHLEILQREQGYKGFNQTGISEIIRHTDPRRSSN